MSVDSFYSANAKFGPHCDERWTGYIAWRQVSQVSEIVSTDTLLCPNLIKEYTSQDWDHNVQEDYRTDFFLDPQYLRERVDYDPLLHNILAITVRPTCDPPVPDGFVHCGYDILDSFESLSVLTNCGSFPEIFPDSEINTLGLLDSRDRANAIANRIRTEYPEESHCMDCRVWYLARYAG
ncbi:hypothetical protein Mal64_16850 [Pseudobythopirellula maris]|uniref:Uncharacterized protein n=1 Tax=Pseudobythopirellula maris TaxID=2527991 RepID=A0A5C5ZM92_9BACT|nr:hypothetical protein [Pseudobythopirellula maris]TWT88206.1 hypothetical protein Mal64_16850 [Pseudobythopirellula maris]